MLYNEWHCERILKYHQCYVGMYVPVYSKAPCWDQKHLILLIYINTCEVIHTVRCLEVENCASVLSVVQTNNYIKNYTVRNILFIFNNRSKIYNQSRSHRSVRTVLAFKVNTKIILLDHNLHNNTTTFQLLSIICMLNNSFHFSNFPPLILVTLNFFQIFNYKTQ